MVNNSDALIQRIEQLKKEKDAVILAHYYTTPEVQSVADFLGDSLALSVKAKEIDAKIILFAGVHFMGETAKVLSPEKKVLIPNPEATCSLAESCKAEKLAEMKVKHPNALVVAYVNTTVGVKALTDICCTSSNALQVVESIPSDKPIIFAPDKNLGSYIQKVTGRKNMILWDGACHVHEQFSVVKILELKKQYPDADVLVHPECKGTVAKLADKVASTAGLLKHAVNSPKKDFIVATESGILHEMRKQCPEKNFIPVPPEDSTCSCNECNFMRLNTLEKLYNTLKYEWPEVTVDPEIAKEAVKPIQRMLEISEKLGL